ncbi:hypothetical protein HMI54_007989 [Coelomomyces lativittatus]|nr:hypothetical protein HMI54_007989 [Coelomomyces lativittatus]KAJ1513664.1 hypothetical protein HMI55_005335 [Coelomomyces lativittatus]
MLSKSTSLPRTTPSSSDPSFTSPFSNSLKPTSSRLKDRLVTLTSSPFRISFPWLSFQKTVPTTFSCFPYEIQVRIFQYLTKRELWTFRRVSKAWYNVITDGPLWSHIDFSEYQQHFPELQMIRCLIFAGKYLRVVDFRGCHHLTHIPFQVFSSFCPQLHTLDISGLSQVTPTTLTHVLSQLPNLRSLSCSRVPTFQDPHLKYVLHHCPQLRKLDVSGCRELTSQGIHQAFVNQRLGLEQLKVSKVTVPPDWFTLVSKTCPKLTCLEVGHVPYLSMVPSSSSSTPNAVVPSMALTHFQVSYTALSDALFTSVFASLATTLTYLELNGCTALTSKGLRVLRHCTLLQYVDMEEVYALDDVTCRTLTAAWTHLKVFNVSFCELLSNSGLVSVFQPTLESLDIDHVWQLTPHALMPLFNPTVSPNLTRLGLGQNPHFSFSFLEHLKQRRPQLRIRSMIGTENDLESDMDDVDRVDDEEEEEEEEDGQEVLELSLVVKCILAFSWPFEKVMQWMWPSHMRVMTAQDEQELRRRVERGRNHPRKMSVCMIM